MVVSIAQAIPAITSGAHECRPRARPNATAGSAAYTANVTATTQTPTAKSRRFIEYQKDAIA